MSRRAQAPVRTILPDPKFHNEMLAKFPKEMRAAFGMDNMDLSTVLGFYSLVFLFVQLCLAIQAANQLLRKFRDGVLWVDLVDLNDDLLVPDEVAKVVGLPGSPGQPVVDAVGVVGQVTRVFPVTAEITLLTDKDQTIPVQIMRNGPRTCEYYYVISDAKSKRAVAPHCRIASCSEAAATTVKPACDSAVLKKCKQPVSSSTTRMRMTGSVRPCRGAYRGRRSAIRPSLATGRKGEAVFTRQRISPVAASSATVEPRVLLVAPKSFSRVPVKTSPPATDGVTINNVFFAPGARTFWHHHERGQILNSAEELREIYKTGSGSVRLRATWEAGTQGRSTKTLFITSIPYTINKAQLVERIAEIAASRKLPPLVDVKDLSTEEVRISLELKRDADERMVMAYLFKHTPLQTSFVVNLTCLEPTEANVEIGRPKRMDLHEILWHFLHFRLEVVTRRLEHELAALKTRVHILEGFEKVFDALDEILKIVRKSEGKPDAAQQIMKRFGLDAEIVDGGVGVIEAFLASGHLSPLHLI